MTLTELKYIIAVAQEKHFGRAAQRCFVSQPTLSIAIKKLEEELNISLFDRSSSEIITTSIESVCCTIYRMFVKIFFPCSCRSMNLFSRTCINLIHSR